MRHRLPNGYEIQVEHIEFVTTILDAGPGSNFRIRFASGHVEAVTGTVQQLEAARAELVAAMGERE